MYIDQCTPVDNSKINFTIVRRFTLINVHLLTIYKKNFTIVRRCTLVNVRIFIFYNITMAMAEAWLGGIGKYPPYPSRLCNTPLVRRLRLRTSGGYCQPLRMRWVFSNTSSPGLCQCPIVIGRKINYSVPDDWYFPISDHQYVLNPFYYSPDEWY